MAYATAVNRGNLFKNKNKDADTSADWTGEVNIEGVMYFIDGWVNDGVNGKYLSLRVKKKNKQPEASHLSTDYDEDIPL